jgi:hypothetical protein
VLISRFSSAGQLLHGRFFGPDESTTNDSARPGTTDYSCEVVVEIYVGCRHSECWSEIDESYHKPFQFKPPVTECQLKDRLVEAHAVNAMTKGRSCEADSERCPPKSHGAGSSSCYRAQ